MPSARPHLKPAEALCEPSELLNKKVSHPWKLQPLPAAAAPSGVRELPNRSSLAGGNVVPTVKAVPKRDGLVGCWRERLLLVHLERHLGSAVELHVFGC